MSIDPTRRFSKRECPSCACEVETNNNRCPICGYFFPSPTPVQHHMRIVGALIMLALLVLLILWNVL